MKSIYLVDLVTDEIHEIKDEKEPKTIGRHSDCNIVTSPNDTSVSRVQGEIVYRANQILYKQLSENSFTFAGTEENPCENRIYTGATEQLQIGNILTMGNHNYKLKIISFKEAEPRLNLEKRARADDTEILKGS